MRKTSKVLALVMALVMTVSLLAGCGGSGSAGGAASAPVEVPEGGYTFPLAEKAEISGLTRYPANTESEPNNRTIYKRLEEATNVHVNWKTIQGDQWGDKIALEMANIKTLPEFIRPHLDPALDRAAGRWQDCHPDHRQYAFHQHRVA